MGKINIKAAALAFGISWGLLIMLTGWLAASGWGVDFVEIFASLYIGYSAGFFGGVIGFIWGFVDGAICGALVAAIYNIVVSAKK